MRPRYATLGLVAVALLSAPARSSAESITMSLIGFPNGSGDVTLNNTTISAAPIGPLSWTQINPANNLPYNTPPNNSFPNPLTTFCIELGNTAETQISPGTRYTFGVRPDLTTAPTIGTQAKADAILELYGRHYNTAWAASGFAGSSDAVAFQLALWELVYDGRSSDPTSLTDSTGHFHVNGADYGAAATTAQSWLNGLTGNPGAFAANLPGMELVALVAPADPSDAKLNTPTQDQLAIRPKAVPAPPAVVLAGLGVVALVGRRKLWKKATA
jgi:hypothetical protein